MTAAPSKRTQVTRKKRGFYDRETIDAIIDDARIGYVGHVIDGQPFVTPTAVWRIEDAIYWHGAVRSRMLQTTGEGAEVCVTIAHLDGLVLAKSAMHHSFNYRSVMLLGRARPVTDLEVKARVLDAFVEHIWPGRSTRSRPADLGELKATTVLTMPIEEASAKIRTGPPVDDAADLSLPHWAGVIPIFQGYGQPVPHEASHA